MTERFKEDERFAHVTKAVAESSFGIQVPPDTLDTWVDLARWWGAADDAIDNTSDPDERRQVRSDLVGYVKGERAEIPSSDPEIIQVLPTVRPIFDGLSEDRQRSFIRSFSIFSNIASERTRTATTVKEYSRSRMLEAQLDMNTFHDTASESMRAHPNFPKYRKTINRMFRATNNIDGAIDLKRDYEAGETQVHPSILNKGYLFFEGAIQALKSIRALNREVISIALGIKKY